MSESNHVGLWNRCLEIIRDNVPDSTYKTWFVPIVPLKYEDKTLIVQVPSQFFYEFLEDKFVDLLRKTLYKVIGEGTKLMYNVMVDRTSIPNKTVNLEASNRSIAVPQPSIIRGNGNKAPNILHAPAPQDLDPHLNPNYNFENFIEGYSNKLSRSVAEAVAQNPAGTAFNPLFLHGASGVGKTHLANAIGTRIKEIYPEKRVLYVSAHLFQVQYTDSVRNNTTNDFINFYQTIDVLIIDDIQFLGSATKGQEEFFHTFNQLHDSNKQIIIASDRSVDDLKMLENRLITRFNWGLTANITPPDFGLRVDIIKRKIAHQEAAEDIPIEVIEYIANINDSDVRQLEGAITRVFAYALMMNHGVVTLDIAIEALKDKISERSVYKNDIHRIQRIVCEYFKIDIEDLKGKKRSKDINYQRQIAIYLCRIMTNESYPKMGTYFGGRDHSTIISAYQKIEKDLETNYQLQTVIEELKKRI